MSTLTPETVFLTEASSRTLGLDPSEIDIDTIRVTNLYATNIGTPTVFNFNHTGAINSAGSWSYTRTGKMVILQISGASSAFLGPSGIFLDTALPVDARPAVGYNYPLIVIDNNVLKPATGWLNIDTAGSVSIAAAISSPLPGRNFVGPGAAGYLPTVVIYVGV